MLKDNQISRNSGSKQLCDQVHLEMSMFWYPIQTVPAHLQTNTNEHQQETAHTTEGSYR